MTPLRTCIVFFTVSAGVLLAWGYSSQLSYAECSGIGGAASSNSVDAYAGPPAVKRFQPSLVYPGSASFASGRWGMVAPTSIMNSQMLQMGSDSKDQFQQRPRAGYSRRQERMPESE